MWSNGVYGVQSGYYTDGYVSAYYIDSTTGCPSERAYEYIEPAPNYDALLTGCYTICPDSLSSDLPVYGFYPYESSDLLWHWFLLGQGEIAHDTTVDPLLPLIDYGTYHMRTEYGNNCLAESPELQIDKTEYCPCDSIELLLEKYQCYVKNCRLYYKLDYTITNNGSSTVVFDHLQVFAGNILVSVNSLPMTIPPSGIRNLEFHVQLSDLMTRTLDYSKSFPNLKIWPNPANNYLFVETDYAQIDYVSVLDLNGKTLLKQSVRDFKTMINVSQLSAGTYFLETVCKGQVSIEKFIKTNIY